MRFILLSLLITASVSVSAQEHFCAKHKQRSASARMTHQARTAQLAPQISHELKYDVKFVHLNLNLERNNKNISGNVKTIAVVSAASLDTFQTILHQNFTVDSIRLNGALVIPFIQDCLVKAKPATPLASGTQFTVVVYYQGIAPTGGAAIGSGYSTGTSGAWGNQVTWSLSESFVAYHWWPCKQILTDKIDSSWVFVTTDSTNKVGSNGILKNVVTIGNKKRYEWKSKNPIDYYLISVAIAKYKEYSFYAKPQYLPNDSILIQNYIYDGAINNPSWINSQKLTLNKMKPVMEFLCNMYGMYPFKNEKYGHCMAPFGGGMEHQTMTSLGFFDYYVDAHELGHQWWGDHITCKSWGDIWINEGFASYTEHLVAQYLDAPSFQSNLNSVHSSVMTQSGGSIFFTGADTLDTPRIFDSRLTYDKGGAILHTLRFLTNNDSLWFNTLRSFQTQFANSTASAVDFKNHYQTQTGIDPTQFFNQWYYGEGYPTFNVKYNFVGNTCFIKSTQSTSMPASVPLFVTPIEYRINRSGAADTTVRVFHNNATETYSFNVLGLVTGVSCDPNNWIINKVVGPSLDATLVGIEENSNVEFKMTVSPNPTKGILNIKDDSGKAHKIFVHDVSGKMLLTKEINFELNLDLSSFSSGIYLVKAQRANGAEFFSQKIIKQ